MRVSIIKTYKMDNLLLPSKIEGNYWITGVDANGVKRNLISIEAVNGEWQLISNNDVYVLQNNERIPFITLKEGNFYQILNKLINEKMIVYCSFTTTNYVSFAINDLLNNGIFIGRGDNNHIVYNAIDNTVGYIKYDNGQIYIFDNNSQSGIYVNNERVIHKKKINIGDVIFISGLKMILNFVNNAYFIYVNEDKLANSKISLPPANLTINNANYEEPYEEVEMRLYDENEYFHRVPRFFPKRETLEITIDPPPSKVDKEDSPLILTIGPMLTMSMTSLVTGYMAFNSVLSGGTTWSNAIPSLIICITMFASIFIWPLFTKNYTKKAKIKNEKERQEKYNKYIQEKRKQINDAKNNEEALLKNNYMTTSEASEVILKKYTTLWQRRKEDEDFLNVNLGQGSSPMHININYPEEHFSMVEDNLKELVLSLGKEPKLLTDVPIILSLREKFITGFIGNKNMTEYVRRLLVQILALHSYDDLKIVILTDDENYYEWKFLKHVPHIFSDDKSIRFFATNTDEYKEVCYYLEKEYNLRKEKYNSLEFKINDNNSVYLIITDNIKKVRDFDIIESILNDKKYLGYSLMILDNKITNLPDGCETFISLDRRGGTLKDNQNINEEMHFAVDLLTPIDYNQLAKSLANIPIEISSNTESQLTNKIGFLEMYDVGKIEQLNAYARWQQNNPILNLQVPVGVGKNGEKISIDLHEKYHGPHGLIAGMTGSGKSEFIITYILSMAINYHPYEVQFILIDYKGGGLAGAFENKITGLKLPHLVGTITNLDRNEIKRSLASIDSELKRRQALFNKAREISNESTIDIYKYQKMYREGKLTEPVSHLFIICDEFAELKQQQPEFMDQLITTARIGRSLGVHLILATQKPSGVVDPQIWSNTRFRVCLRVQDKSDSNEIIKCPDAAFIKQTGRFYFQVGYNEVFQLGQAAYAGGKYMPMEKVQKSLDTSIDFIDNIGYIVKKCDTKVTPLTPSVGNMGEELTNIVKYLHEIAQSHDIHCRPLWLEKISDNIRVEDLAIKYNYQKEKAIINPIIGEYDIPFRQEQQLLTLPLTKEGNAIVYGTSGSGKENFITTMIYASSLYYSPLELNYYILDFGSESLKAFNDYPLVGDVVTIDDEDKVTNLYKMLHAIIDERKDLFAEFNGDYYTYCCNSGHLVPAIVVVINNYENYVENYGDLEDDLNILTREANKYGIYFVLTVNTPNGVRFKLRQNFALIYALQQNSEDDYSIILGNVHQNYPAKIFGRGIFKSDEVYEFQTALVSDHDSISQFIKSKKAELIKKYPQKALNIPVLPKKVTYADIYKYFNHSHEVIIGINKNNLEPCTFNFENQSISIITGFDLNNLDVFINPLINQLLALNKANLIVINADDYKIDKTYQKAYTYVDNNFDEIFNNLNNYLDNLQTVYVNNNYNKSSLNNYQKIYCLILGINSFKSRLNNENKNNWDNFFNKVKTLEKINFIIVDSIDVIKKMEIDSWYKNCTNNNYGIWLGNGLNDQFSIRVIQKIPEMKEDVPYNFCFVVKKGKSEYVKFVEEFNIKIEK